MKALTAASKKQKGNRLENRFAQLIRHTGLDDRATRMVMSGAVFGFETDIKTTLPFAFECKNQEKVKLWEFWEQAERGRTAIKPPVLVVSGNYRPILCILKAEDFLQVLAELRDYKEMADGR